MSTALRITRVAMAMAIAVAPVAFDECWMICGGVAGTAGAPSAAPSCHRVGREPAGPGQIGSVPASCTHDHDQTALLPESNRVRAALETAPAASPNLPEPALSTIAFHAFAPRLKPPLSRQRAADPILPLRV